MLTWATVDPDNRLELERFFFEMYCEELCDATGDPEEDKPIEGDGSGVAAHSRRQRSLLCSTSELPGMNLAPVTCGHAIQCRSLPCL